MPTPTKGPRLGGSPAHQRIILDNLASQLFEHGRITTTEAKAKRVRPLAEKLITKAKRGDQHSRRLVLTHIRDKSVVHQLFTEIASAVENRDGGYTRITKIGPRKGDNAPMAIIEIVTEPVSSGKRSTPAAASKPAQPAAPVVAEAVDPDVSEPDTAAADTADADTDQNVASEAVATPEADVTADEATVAAADEATPEPAPVDGVYRGENPPDGFTIKGNEDSMKYHTTESRWYEQTVAEVWFDTPEAAERAGFTNAAPSTQE